MYGVKTPNMLISVDEYGDWNPHLVLPNLRKPSQIVRNVSMCINALLFAIVATQHLERPCSPAVAETFILYLEK